MKKVPLHIQYWLDSFLLIDLGFAIALLYSCLTDGISCFENAVFGIGMFYMPWNLPLIFLPVQVDTFWSLIIMLVVGLTAHIVLAFLFARLFKKYKLHRLVVFLLAFLIVVGSAMAAFMILAQLGFIS